MTWIDETLYPDWRQGFRVLAEIAQERSAYQDLRIVQTAGHGRVLFLDGVVQITERDDFVYQEMIAHVPLIQHGRAENVLIIGAGDGGVLRRVLQHRTVRRAILVEIDEAVIRLSRAHMPDIGGDSWTDARADIRVADGIAFMRTAASGSQDIIIVDSTDPAGPGEALFTDAFYRDCARVLTPTGLLVNQSGVPFMQPEELADTTKRRAAAFTHVGAYVAAVPTYVGGLMTLGIASNTAIAPLPPAEACDRAQTAGIFGATRYWSPHVHGAAFALPPYIAAHLPEAG